MNDKLGRVAVVALALAQLAGLALFGRELIRTGPTLVVCAAVVGCLALRNANRSTRPHRTRLALYLGSSAAIVLALTGPSLYEMSRGLVVLLLGWSVPLVLGESDDTARPALAGASTGVAALWLIAIAGLWIAMRPPAPHPIGLDEALYLLQSQHLRRAPFMWPVDAQLAPFFLIRQTYAASGYLNGQYPPGWPLVLSLASGLRSSWVVLFATCATVLGATYAFGRVVGGPRVGALAAGLLGVNTFFLDLSTQFLPHAFGAALALVAATLMVSTIDASGQRRTAAWALAGLLLGGAVAARPLTGIALAATLWLWVLLRQRPSMPKAAAATAAACAGAVIPIGLLMYYNLETTGALTRFGYDVAEHGLHALGFGMRGFVEYTNAGVPVERVVAFGSADALRNVCENLYAGFLNIWPAALIFPIAYLASRAGVSWRWRPVFAFALLPLAYFFYFYHFAAERFYSELLPFAMVGTAFLLYELARLRPAVGVPATAMFVATMLLGTATLIVERRRGSDEQWIQSSAIVERLRADHSKLLVFVHSELPQQDADPGTESVRWWGEPGMQPLYWYNVYGFPSDVIVARDLGARDSLLSRRFPGRYEVELSLRPGPPGGAAWVFAATPRIP